MINYSLPTTMALGDKEFSIRSDYRAILDIMAAMNDVDLTNEERAAVALEIFYPEYDKIPSEYLKEAIEKCYEFIDGGERREGNAPPVVSWEQDFQYIIAPINAVAGYEVRSVDYLHWWTFLSYYMEIDGECTFAQIVNIRDKKARGKKLEKYEREWYERNRSIVDKKTQYTEEELQLLELWGGHNDQR